jgi:hypothetical protein
MASTTMLACFIAFVAVTPISVNAASSEIFPSLRKRRVDQEKLSLMAESPKAEAAKRDDATVKVPDPVDVGANGLPQLPAVSTMLSEASGTAKSVGSQASTLEAQVVQAQMKSESKMAKQKAAYEMKLKQQEMGNRAVIAANANISAEIKQLKSRNDAYRKHAKELQESNRVMRSELKALDARLITAMQFVDKSLEATDDSKNALLQVLQVPGTQHNHHHDALLEKDDDDDSSEESDKLDDSDEEDIEDAASSFLSLSQKTHRLSTDVSYTAAIDELENVVPTNTVLMEASGPNPDDLLAVLAKQVAQLAQQEKESEKKLKELFIRDFRAGVKRHQALMAQQKTLLAKRGSLSTVQSELKTAEAHLDGVRQQLVGRLHGLGQYMQKLAHFAMAPQREIPHLLAVLPKEVTIPVKAK